MKDNEGAQITIDYAAGVGIFLLSVAFVFQFMGGLFIPFQAGSEEIMLIAERTSIVMVDHLLVPDRSESMNVIDQGKLNYFNNVKLNFSNQSDYKKGLLETGLYSDEIIFDINMSISYLNGAPMIQGGPGLPENIDIGQARRLVLIVNSSTGYNQTAILSVRVW